jgi:hypothetical protein
LTAATSAAATTPATIATATPTAITTTTKAIRATKTIRAIKATKTIRAIKTIKAIKTTKTTKTSEYYSNLSILIHIVLVWIPRNGLVRLEIPHIQHLKFILEIIHFSYLRF